MEAIALPGYEFSHWSGSVSGTNPVLEITPTADMQIQANFEAGATPPEIIYFWLMDSNIPNDTPLEFLDATYTNNTQNSSITYTSCLDGYPFTNTHPDWRKASFERKNAPTPLNYRPEANDDIPYSSDIMKGIQIKQPFKSGDMENIVEFHIPTIDYNNIKLSFAVSTDGAAHTLLIDYWNGTEWTTTNLANPSESISDIYELKLFDFSNIPEANNNTDFTVRMQFEGTDMFIEEGKEVVLNNIAVEGESSLSTETIHTEETIKVFPNPTDNILNIQSSELVDHVIFYNTFGQIIKEVKPKKMKFEISTETFAQGMYFMKVLSNNSEKVIKVIRK